MLDFAPILRGCYVTFCTHPERTLMLPLCTVLLRHLMMTKTGGGVTKFNPALSSDSCYTLHLPTEVDIQ